MQIVISAVLAWLLDRAAEWVLNHVFHVPRTA